MLRRRRVGAKWRARLGGALACELRVCSIAHFRFRFGVGQWLIFSDFSADGAIPNSSAKYKGVFGCVFSSSGSISG